MDQRRSQTSLMWRDDAGIVHMVATGERGSAQSVDQNSLVIPFRRFSDEAAAMAFLRSHNQ